jgi:uncharacterized protein (DUF885 family)
MKRLLRRAGLAALALVVAAAALAAHTWWFKPLSIDWFYTRVFARFALDRPQMLSSLRVLPGWIGFYADDLDDASPAQTERDAQRVRDDLATLHRYDRAALDENGRLSYDALEYFLRIQADGERFRYHDFPVSQLFGEHTQFPDFMLQVHAVDGAGDARDYIRRLEKVDAKFDGLLASLELRAARGIVPPRFAVDKVLAQLGAFTAVAPSEHVLVTALADKLDRLPAGRVDAAAREQLVRQAQQAVQAHVLPAYRKLHAHVQALRERADGDFGAWRLPDGDAYYAWCVRQHTTTDMAPDELHRIGVAEVARIGAEMDAILKSRGLADGSIGARVQRLAREPAQQYADTAEGKAALLERYREILAEAERALPRAFDLQPKAALEVKAVPAFAQATAPAAYYQPGAFDGSRPGVFFVNVRDIRETPKFAMRTLAYHEGIPGHHFQTAIAQEVPGLPFFRRVLPFTAYAEGWALYAERLAFEMGLAEDPLDNLGRLRDEMLRAVRLVVDTGIHGQRWTREQAIAYMAEHTGMAESDIVTEVERYFVDPGQALAYKVGMLKMLALREKARAALGPRFDLPGFHRALLAHGAMPLVVLERVVDDWIARRKAAS